MRQTLLLHIRQDKNMEHPAHRFHRGMIPIAFCNFCCDSSFHFLWYQHNNNFAVKLLFILTANFIQKKILPIHLWCIHVRNPARNFFVTKKSLQRIFIPFTLATIDVFPSPTAWTTPVFVTVANFLISR